LFGVEELMDFLKDLKPMDPVIYDSNLEKAAKDHVLNMGP
jgi:hypothetical protein